MGRALFKVGVGVFFNGYEIPEDKNYCMVESNKTLK